MTRSNALANIHNLILRYEEEWDGLSEASKIGQGAWYFENLAREILEYCEDADDYYQE